MENKKERFWWFKTHWNNAPVYKWTVILIAGLIPVSPFVLRQVDRWYFNNPHAPLVWDYSYWALFALGCLIGGSWLFRNNV